MPNVLNKNEELLAASSRLALAAYLHDLGKFTERAGINNKSDQLETYIQQYCKENKKKGKPWFSHKHAAHTVLAWDIIEKNFPELVGNNITPFSAWNAAELDDSIVNVAASHHKPNTFLQWVIATADRVASGFDREEFEKYNQAEDENKNLKTGRNHYTLRQLTLFEQINQIQPRQALNFRYPLSPLSVASLFPVKAEDHEGNNNKAAQLEYQSLWSQFEKSLQEIPQLHSTNWPLWLDHFDSAWACFTQAIPAATAVGTKPEVSLYDHSRTTAAIATALWRYHSDQNNDTQVALKALSDDKQSDWDDNKFLLIQGDFFGVQDFIFATGGESQRQAVKLLRGRSFYVSLLMECAALKILEALSLPPTSQVINAAGKFLIVAPNSHQIITQLKTIQIELNRWFLDKTWGESGIGLAWIEASCNDFVTAKETKSSAFNSLVQRLFDELDIAKSQRFNLCNDQAPDPLFDKFLDSFSEHETVCALDGRSPAALPMKNNKEKYISKLAADQISIGEYVVKANRILLTTESLNHNTLLLNIFGYYVNFTAEEEVSGKFGKIARDNILRRAWDYSLPEKENEVLFKGYARRFINGYVARFADINTYDKERYLNIEDKVDFSFENNSLKTFEHLAVDDKAWDENNKLYGETAITVLKGDVDNLGNMFKEGLQQPTFAKMTALSRQLNAFFAVYLPTLCARKYQNTYTVFAGGDDFFLIGPWRSTMELAVEMNDEFKRYVAYNSNIHFSVGMTMSKPGHPIKHLSHLAEHALDQAKAFDNGNKNAVSLLGFTISWSQFEKLWKVFDALDHHANDLELSTSYLYSLQYFSDMAEDLKSKQPNMESAMWNSRFTYRTWRMLQDKKRLDKSARERWQKELGRLIGGGICEHAGAFRIPLSIYLYSHRK